MPMSLPGAGWTRVLHCESMPDEQREQVELQIEVQAKYAGYIERQQREIAKHAKQERVRLPEDIDYSLPSTGCRTKHASGWKHARPVTIGPGLAARRHDAVSRFLVVDSPEEAPTASLKSA